MAKVGDKIKLNDAGLSTVDTVLKDDLRDTYTLKAQKNIYGELVWLTEEPIGWFPGLLLLDDEFEVVD